MYTFLKEYSLGIFTVIIIILLIKMIPILKINIPIYPMMNLANNQLNNFNNNMESNDIDYENLAILSCNKEGMLNISNGNFYIDGWIHSNGTIRIHPGPSTLKAATSNKGLIGDVVNINLIQDDGTLSPATNEFVKYSNIIEIPTVVLNDMNKLIPIHLQYPIVNENWNIYESSGMLAFESWSDGNELKKYLNEDKSIYINYFGNYAMPGYLTTNNDLYIKCQNDTTFQPTQTTVINGDVYIDIPKDKTFTLAAYSTDITINGNVYCLNGDLNLPNVKIIGNLYCGGTLKNGGNQTTIYAPNYIYANKIESTNSFDISGTLICENDISLSAGNFTKILNNNRRLSVYSINGNIILGMNVAEIHGIILAPKGNITISGSNISIYGKLISDTITLNTGINIYATSNN